MIKAYLGRFSDHLAILVPPYQKSETVLSGIVSLGLNPEGQWWGLHGLRIWRFQYLTSCYEADLVLILHFAVPEVTEV